MSKNQKECTLRHSYRPFQFCTCNYSKEPTWGIFQWAKSSIASAAAAVHVPSNERRSWLLRPVRKPLQKERAAMRPKTNFDLTDVCQQTFA